MGGVPSVPTDPSRKIQVISAGFSRTGTVSMSLALEKLLDGPVCHGGTQMVGREDAYVKKWIEVYRLRHDKPRLMKKLAEVTAGFVAIADVPGNHFIPELMELYPEAKVIDVHRDPVKWWASMDYMIKNATLRWLYVFFWPMPTWRWFPVAIDCMMTRTWEINGKRELPAGPEMLEVHHQYVRDVVEDKNKLFVMDLKDGWAPLCKFLDKPVPKEPFPRVNDKDAVDKLMRDMVVKTCLVWLVIFFVVIALVVGLGLWGFWFET